VGPAALLELLSADGLFDTADPWPADGSGRARLARVLAAWRPDLAIVMPPSFSSAWFAWRSGARTRVGLAADGRSPLLTHAVPRVARGDRHVAEDYLALGAAVGAPAVEPPPLAIPPAWREGAEAILAEDGVRGPYAVIAPGAAYGPAKRWAPERFTDLGRAFESRGWSVLVCGAAGERPLAISVTGAIGDGARAFAGRTSIGVQAALCARATVVVSNDSGLAHLAAATGAPTVAIFGSTSSAWTAPRGPRVRVVQRAPVCSPCFRRTCRIGTPCLTAIAVEDVVRACGTFAT